MGLLVTRLAESGKLFLRAPFRGEESLAHGAGYSATFCPQDAPGPTAVDFRRLAERRLNCRSLAPEEPTPTFGGLFLEETFLSCS